jgi:hypothetical protein
MSKDGWWTSQGTRGVVNLETVILSILERTRSRMVLFLYKTVLN